MKWSDARANAVIAAHSCISISKSLGKMVPLGPSPSHQASVGNTTGATASGTKSSTAVVSYYAVGYAAYECKTHMANQSTWQTGGVRSIHRTIDVTRWICNGKFKSFLREKFLRVFVRVKVNERCLTLSSAALPLISLSSLFGIWIGMWNACSFFLFAETQLFIKVHFSRSY